MGTRRACAAILGTPAPRFATSPTATSPSTPSACFLSTRTAEGWRGSSHSCTIGVSRWPASVRAM
uniref:Uncharacterized protein n=1 Tax=Oryza rufipogon TaxID=4529 RepID=A0A0E0PXA1_ORYRU